MTAPPRAGAFLPWLLAAALVDWIGTGLFLAVSTVFFVRVVGLSTVAVGSGLTVAALAAMLVALPVGRMADRFGPRRVLVSVELIQGVATAAYLTAHGWLPFLVVTFVVAVTQQAAPPLIQALVGEVTAADRRTKVLALHRTVINVGISVGSLSAGLVLGLGLPHAFQLLLIADAVAFVVAAVILALLPIRTQVIRRPSGDRWAALRDTRLQAWTAYDAVLSLWQPILNVAFPIWLATRTDAPLSLVGVLYTVHGVIAIALQYPAGKLATTPTRAVRGYAGAALCLAAASVGFAMASESSATFTVVALTVSVVLLTLGEITQVGSAWTVSFTIAPPDRRNAYLAAFSLGRAFSRAVGPLLMTGAVLALGRAGWLTLAAVFALAAVAPLLVTKQSALTSSTANEHDDTARAHERR